MLKFSLHFIIYFAHITIVLHKEDKKEKKSVFNIFELEFDVAFTVHFATACIIKLTACILLSAIKLIA